MRTNDDKRKFIEEISEVPLISIVCKRLGIAKATIYRWRSRDRKFAKKLAEALSRGRSGINDIAEGQIIGSIRKGDFRASKFWLENNSKRYIKPRAKNILDPVYKGIEKITFVMAPDKPTSEQTL